MNGERVIPHGQVGLRGCLPYGRQAGHGHGETVGEQVQGGVRQGNEETEGRGPGPARGRGHGPVHRSASALAGGQGQGRTGAGRGGKPTCGEDAQRVLERLRLLMGMPCGPYMKAMFGQWVPALRANGELDGICM